MDATPLETARVLTVGYGNRVGRECRESMVRSIVKMTTNDNGLTTHNDNLITNNDSLMIKDDGLTAQDDSLMINHGSLMTNHDSLMTIWRQNAPQVNSV